MTKILQEIAKGLKQRTCRHKWETYQSFIYNPDAEPKQSAGSYKKRWFMEVREYMRAIGLDGLLPYFFHECKKCGKQTIPAIDTLIKATIIDWYIPEYVWNEEDYSTHVDNKYPTETLEMIT